MIDRAEWLLQVRGAVASDEQQTLCKISACGGRAQDVGERLR